MLFNDNFLAAYEVVWYNKQTPKVVFFARTFPPVICNFANIGTLNGTRNVGEFYTLRHFNKKKNNNHLSNLTKINDTCIYEQLFHKMYVC